MFIKLIKFSINIIFFTLFLLNVACANKYSSVNYTISPLSQLNNKAIKVEVEIKGDLSGKLIVNLPCKYTATIVSEDIRNIKCSYSDGSNCDFRINKHNEMIIAGRKYNKNIQVSYELYEKKDNIYNGQEIIIRKNLIYSAGSNIFATIGNNIKYTDKIQYSINWKNMPSDWKYISSHGVSNNLKFTSTLQNLGHAIYVAGNLRLYQINDQENPIFLSLCGDFDNNEVYYNFVNISMIV